MNTAMKQHHQQGVTLVELMIAMVISLIVLLGVTTVYSSSKRAYRIQEEMARLQENARYAFQVLASDIRIAGYSGCNPTFKNHLNRAHAKYNEALFDFQAGIDGWEYTQSNTTPGQDYTITSLTDTGVINEWRGIDWDNNGSGDPLANSLSEKILKGNDVLVTKSAETLDFLIPEGSTASDAEQIELNANHNIAQGAIIIFGDCNKGDVFQNNSIGNTLTRPADAGAPGNLDPDEERWSHTFDTRARVQTVKIHAFFIAPGASGEPALFRADFSQGSAGIISQEIVEGVENMQILYGEDRTPGDDFHQPTIYVSADDVEDPDNIISVRVSLLLRTPRELNRPQRATTHRLLGVEDATGVDITTQADRRIRKVFNSTFYLRNKGLFRERI